jgi:MscS family membrane protein
MLDLESLPDWVREVLVIVAIIVGTFLAAVICLWLLRQFRRRVASRTKTELDDMIMKAITKPFFWFVVVAGSSVLINHVTHRFSEYVGWFRVYAFGAIWTIGAVLITIIALRLINVLTAWMTRSIVQRTEDDVFGEFLPLLQRALRMVTIVVAALVILEHFHIDIKGLLTVLGVGSLAIALAAKDTIENMISGFIMMIDRPFRIGDRVILSSGEKCDVHQIGLRSTRFKTFENTLIILPNRELLTSKIENVSYPDSQIRIKVEVGVAYGSDIDRVRELLVQCAADHPKILSDPRPYAHVTGLGDSSVDFSLRGRVAAITDQWTTQNELREMIYDRLNEAGIEIPFPQRTVWLKKEEAV